MTTLLIILLAASVAIPFGLKALPTLFPEVAGNKGYQIARKVPWIIVTNVGIVVALGLYISLKLKAI